MIRAALMAAAVAGAALSCPFLASAFAQDAVGAGITFVPIAVTARQGQTVTADVFIVNTGNVPATYGFQLVTHPGDKPVPPAWVERPKPIPLGPGERALVPLEIKIPTGAPTGDFQSVLVIAASNGATASAAQTGAVGAAAGTLLSLKVTVGLATLWPFAVAGGLLLLVPLVLVLWRRFR